MKMTMSAYLVGATVAIFQLFSQYSSRI